jgi:cell division cycle 2-like protein
VSSYSSFIETFKIINKRQSNSGKRLTVSESDDSRARTRSRSTTPIVSSSPDVDTDIELTKDTLPPYLPAIQGCRSVEEFQCLNR